MSKVEVFIILRIKNLVEVGWSYKAIADALRVTVEFVERAATIKIG